MRAGKKRSAFRRILASVARAQLAEVLEAVGEGKERILIDRRGKPPVALVSVDDLLQLQLSEARLRAAENARPAEKPRGGASPARTRRGSPRVSA